MENEPVVFAGTAIIDAAVLAGTAIIDAAADLARSRPSQRDHDLPLVATGGVKASHIGAGENTSLLSGEEGSTYDVQGDFSVERRGEFKWQGENDFEGVSWWNKPSVLWIIPPFFLTTLAFGGTVIPKINLILALICKKYLSKQSVQDTSFIFMPVMLGGENPQCQIPEVQSLVSNFTLYGNLISGLLSAVTSPKLGSLSDRYGRAKVMACMILGLLVSETITLLTATFPDILPVQLLLLGFLFDGLAGSFTAGMAVTFAYASDCTPPARRKVVFGWLHGCLFGGFALGPILGGYIVKASGKIVTIFYVTLACHCAFFLFLAFLLPESLTRQRQVVAREKYTRGVLGHSWTWVTYIYSLLKGSNLLGPLKILYPTGAGSSNALRRNLMLLAAVDTAMFGVAMGSMTVVIIYSEYIFSWGNFETNVFISIVNIFRVLVLLLLLPLISRFFKSREARTSLQQNSGSDTLDLSIIRVAVFFDLVGYIGYAIVKTGPLFILSGTIASIGGMGPPTLSAALTKHVPQDRTGEVLGAMGFLHALARVVAPTIFNLIYSLTVATTPQTIFICLSSVFGAAFVLSWFIKPHVYIHDAASPKTANDVSQEESEVLLNNVEA